MLFSSSDSLKSIDKFEITGLNTLLLFISTLYVDTNFEFNVISVVVIVSVFPVEFSDFPKSSVVDDVYTGVTNPIVYITPINMNIATISSIFTFLFQNNISNSFKSNSSIFSLLF